MLLDVAAISKFYLIEKMESNFNDDEKIRPRFGKRVLDNRSFWKREPGFKVEKIRPRLGKRFLGYKSLGKKCYILCR